MNDMEFLRNSFISSINPNSNTNSNTKFTSYKKDIFDTIRINDGLDDSVFFKSFSNIKKYGANASKSGSVFYITDDERFIIKSVSKSERNFLKKIAKKYQEYLAQNKDTYLIKFYGLYKLKQENIIPKRLRFVVMNNIFHTTTRLFKPDRTYDLKGTTEDRFVKSNSGVLKDLNFIKNNEQIKMSKEQALLFRQQITKDVNFLSSTGIMDYSLIIGINDMSTSILNQFSQTAQHTRCEMAIIDILQNWTLKKKLARAIKKIWYGNRTKIDSEPPTVYGKRFVEYACSSVTTI
jgi:1-phosphatidylinositol-4-phosphate 5-kinase